MLVVFPFEVELYKDAGVDVEYVGHPLTEVVSSKLTKEEARAKLALEEQGSVITLLPGSRTAEVSRLLPPMLAAAEIIAKELGEPRYELSHLRRLQHRGRKAERPHRGQVRRGVSIVRDDMYTALRASDAAITASGTATLETALIGTPMVIVYRVSAITYMIARGLVGTRDIGLPNIVASKSFIKELVQAEATPVNIAKEILEILEDSQKRNDMMRNYEAIRAGLGDGSAADMAAAAVIGVISKKPPSAEG